MFRGPVIIQYVRRARVLMRDQFDVSLLYIDDIVLFVQEVLTHLI